MASSDFELSEGEWVVLESMGLPGLTVVSHVYRLEDLGLVEKVGDGFRLTDAGIEVLRTRHD